MKVVVVDEWSL